VSPPLPPMAEYCPQYCEVALPVPLDRAFTYSIPAGLSIVPGMRVLAPFGTRTLVGVVLRSAGLPQGLPPDEIKSIRFALEDTPAVSEEFLRLSQWIAHYYLVPQGEVLAAMLPLPASRHQKSRIVLTDLGLEALASAEESSATRSSEEVSLLRRIAKRGGIRRETLRQQAALVAKLKRKGWLRVESSVDTSTGGPRPATEKIESAGIGALPFELTREQSQALARIQEQIEAGAFGVILLHGITGSGKTEVYMRAIEFALARGRSALMLVPEIGLTPAMTGLFAERFGSRVAVLHSGFRSQEREAQWHRVHAGAADIVIGTRSAVFAPLDRPGLIIVDEEHDGSYKQEEAPRYHGRDVAIVRAQQANATVVLGSATPAIESRYHAETGKYQLLELEARVQDRPLPRTEIVDMRQEFAETGRQSFLSRRLNDEISKRLSQHEQILILLNRRGYSAFVLCRSCGKAIECENCSIALTHHRRLAQLLCHYCGFARPVPRLCPQCSGEHLYFMGEGSERVEETLHRHFPEARIGRLDRDTARGHGRAESILAAFQQYELDILVGTQMIAKGHDIHKVTLVGVISADIGLARPDFRAAERTFQLLTQVAGRAGRGELPGEVIIQTYYPDHYAIRASAAQDYSQFYWQELRFREVMRYPPFSALANVLVKSATAESAMKLAGRLGRHLEMLEGRDCSVLGPAAAPIPRLKRSYRYHFLLKAAHRSSLHKILESCREFASREKFPAAALIIDVDPQSLL
jgi:primosomal protein N' (replication factor Y) (superfamily II helicase)